MNRLAMNRLSWLEDIHVVTGDGTRVGRVFEVRSPGRAETEPTYAERPIDCLLCGRLGLFERLGWKEPDALAIPWKEVLEIRPHTIVVRGPVNSYAKLEAYRSET